MMMQSGYNCSAEDWSEYLTSLNTFRNSFDMAYTNNTQFSPAMGDMYNYEKQIVDDNSSDSGVPSDTMEDYQSDVSPNTELSTVRHQGRHQEKPLSAWKLKQLRLTPAGIKKRRKDANARERKRMNGLNEAFERLRDAVPGLEENNGDKNKKLSKMDTLQMANLYIRHLATLLNDDKTIMH